MREIRLSQGQVALVDEEDFDRVNQFKWCAVRIGRRYYGKRNVVHADGVRTTELLHNFILGFEGVDHRDGDGRNNQRKNLRPANTQQNARARRRKMVGTSSRFRGVTWYSPLEKWQAQLGSGGTKFFLGRFSDETEAAKAYDAAALKHFGEFASPNFPTQIPAPKTSLTELLT